jgi:uncharacterized membrane protein (DUF2068 family)
MKEDHHDRVTLAVIGAFKLAKSILLLALGLVLLHLVHSDVAASVASWIRPLHIDPDNRYLGRAVHALLALDEAQLKAATAGVFVYTGVFLTEGIGLLLRKRWAEYFTAIVTGSLVPLEIYEVVRHPGAVRAAVLLANVAIVWYLARRLHAGAGGGRRQCSATNR